MPDSYTIQLDKKNKESACKLYSNMGNTCFRPCYKTTVKEDEGFQEVAINSKQVKYVEKEIPDNLTKKGLAAYIPEISSGRVVDVYDGDTFTIAGRVAYNPSLFKFL